MLRTRNLEELKTSTGKTYLRIQADLDENWIYSNWIGYPTPENVAKGSFAYFGFLQAHSMNSILNDNRNLVGRWDQSLDWIRQVWVPSAVEAGLRYFAHIAPSDALSASAAGVMQEFVKAQVNMQVFNDIEPAKAWLRSVRK